MRAGCGGDAEDGDEEQQGEGCLREGEDRYQAHEGGAQPYRQVRLTANGICGNQCCLIRIGFSEDPDPDC